MGAYEIHKNDVGTSFLVTVKDGTTVVDLTTLSAVEYIFKKPSKAVITRTGGLVSGILGQVNYISIAGDLDEVGDWSLQLDITTPAGRWKTDITKFRVYDNLS
jgi:hypothetical protein